MKYLEDISIQGRKSEIDKKITKIREVMEEKSLDAVLINRQQNFSWITAGGCNIVTRFVDSGACTILVTFEGQYYICKNIEALRMEEEESLDLLGFKKRVCYWYEDKTLDFIHELIGLNGKYASDSPIKGASDAQPFILMLQRVLSDSEIIRYFRMGEIFSELIERFMLTIKPGDSEKEIAGRLASDMWSNQLEPVLFLVAADERIYKHRHAIPTDKRLDKMLMISCNSRYKGMVTKISRMMYFGRLPDDIRKQYEQTLDIENQMAAATKPGVDDIEVFRLAQRLYDDYGYPGEWKLHHQGGPQSYTNGFYVINDNNHEVIRKNQIYGYNPSITGTKTEDAFLVTDDGPDFVTYPVYFPKEISVIEDFEYVRPGIYEVN